MDAEINGMILWCEAAYTVRVERSLLILDAMSWAWSAAARRGHLSGRR